MKWLRNIPNPSDPGNFFGAVVPLDGATPLQVRDRLQKWLADKIIGAPQATDRHTVDELRAMGFVGVYSIETEGAK
jgi:hypothetical protein